VPYARRGGSAFLGDGQLNQLQRLETRVAVLADDEMVVHGNAEFPNEPQIRSEHYQFCGCP
jgi:hypothetical protein